MDLKNSTGYLISNTGRKLSQCLQQLFHSHDVTPEQWTLLVCLDTEDGISHKDLAIRTEKDPANLTRLVDQLERKELVLRIANPADRRSLLLQVTEKGRVAAHALAPIEATLNENIVKGITTEEMEAFKIFMSKVNKNADELLAKPNE